MKQKVNNGNIRVKHFYGVALQLSPVTLKYDSNSNAILEFFRAMLWKIHLL